MSRSETDHDQLPLPDYDHLPLASLGQRIRTLDADALSVVLAYEKQHGNRLPATQLLQARLEELQSGAEPSGGSPLGLAPEKSTGPAAPRQTDQTTDAPTINPPSQGDPTNPGQPRR
ncbi:MAG TPA: hypothetical protein VF635_04175, partial [Propionibacteriaceae bacterium]